MHTIKRQAHSNAWKSKTNPFGKYQAPSRSDTLNDAERGDAPLAKVATDEHNGKQSTDAQRRRLDLVGSRSPPPHADTAPNSYSRFDRGQRVDDIEPPYRSTSPVEEDHEQMVKEYDDKAKDSGSSETVTGADEKAPHDHHHLPHLKGIVHRKKDHENKEETAEENDVEGTDSEEKTKLPKKKFTFMSQIRATILNSWINVLLIFSPIGIIVYYVHIAPVAVFVINFIAIIPLAAMLSYATEEIALRTGETVGGLLNASFGNAVELIVSIIALTQNQVLIVQTSLIGSMLSNLLLVMGMSFFFGGINRIEQAFNMTVAQTASSLLFLAVSALIIPTAFHAWSGAGEVGIAPLSRGTAIMLLLVYGCYLFFQLKSHAAMYNAPSDKNEKRDMSKHTKKLKEKVKLGRHRHAAAGAVATNGMRPDTPSSQDSADDNKPEEPQLAIITAIITLAGSTVLVALNAEYLVDSIDAITCGGGISKNFVGLILLPIVGNAAEHATSVTVAIKDKMDLAIGVAVGSSMQIALLVLPFVVVLGWILGKEDMTLYFDGFQIAVLFVAVLLVNYLIQDGKSHWLEGVLLFTLYVIIAVAAWFYPTKPGLSDCPTK